MVRVLKAPTGDMQLINFGAYAHVFVSHDRAVVRKVFLRKPDEVHVQSVFGSELSALRIASEQPKLRAIVPKFFGQQGAASVFEGQHDVSAEYFPALSYEMEFVPGAFVKIGNIDPAMRASIGALFEAHGICHWVMRQWHSLKARRR